MKNTIKNIVSVMGLIALINTVAIASEQDYGSDAYHGSVIQQGNITFSNDISDEVDAFTLDSSTYTSLTPHKVSMLKDGNIPTNTVFSDPLYYSSNK